VHAGSNSVLLFSSMPGKLIIENLREQEPGDSIPDLQLHVEELYRDCRNDVYAYLITLGLPPAQAQDTTQEVFLRYYVTRQQRDESIENPRAWIFRVAHNLGLKVRSKQARLHPIDDELERRLSDHAVNPERGAIDNQRRSRVEQAIEELSGQQKQCLFLRAEGLRYREIAEVIGIRSSSVSEFLKRAITKLRKVAGE
jgi:RNA polymerase sigma-70 factor (ECF subfamily)